MFQMNWSTLVYSERHRIRKDTHAKWQNENARTEELLRNEIAHFSLIQIKRDVSRDWFWRDGIVWNVPRGNVGDVEEQPDKRREPPNLPSYASGSSSMQMH